MKLFKFAIIAFVLLINVLVAPPSLADRGKFMQSSDYADVNKAIEALVQAKNDPNSSMPTAQMLQKLGDLQRLCCMIKKWTD